jgi:hypothetical protein
MQARYFHFAPAARWTAQHAAAQLHVRRTRDRWQLFFCEVLAVDQNWIDLYNDAVKDHYALWNYLWVGAAALIALTGMVVKDHKGAVRMAVPFLVLGFVGFAVVNGILLFQSQLVKLAYFDQLQKADNAVLSAGGEPWHPYLIVAGHLAIDAIVIAIACMLAAVSVAVDLPPNSSLERTREK